MFKGVGTVFVYLGNIAKLYHNIILFQNLVKYENRTNEKNSSILDGLGIEVFLNHKRHFEYDGVVKLPQIKARELFDFFKSVNKGVTVNKKLA